jgi:hypothetical protein
MSQLISIITADDSAIRDTSVESVCQKLTLDQLLAECDSLDHYRRDCPNLYRRVRALFFLYSIYRFFIPVKLNGAAGKGASISFDANSNLLERRFTEAIDMFLIEQLKVGISDTIASALAKAYYQLAIQNLADQVRASVRAVRGNQWMFRTGEARDFPLRIRPELIQKTNGVFPIIHEKTAVRMDLSHSAWSDIFFLGMDYPAGARVLNISVDLAVHGRDAKATPPVEAMFRVIDKPVIRLVSVDLGASAEITELSEIFNFAKDYLGLLKAALIASGVIPIAMEGSGQSLQALLARLLGPGLGIELVSNVNDIPKGSRLAVSTNLLGGLIAVCMRATGQTASLTDPLAENERRIAAARAILGEWLGGSGGGWQDSGGIWPGIKVIEGCVAAEGDPEFGISRGRLMPSHTLLGTDIVPLSTHEKLQQSLILVHGGMAQNVGPILEMVTEKYLLRSGAEWDARQESMRMFDAILDALKSGDIQELGKLTTQHFYGPLQKIIPWSTTFFTERLIESVRSEFGDDFWGFWMLGGMSGGGMGFMFAPEKKAEALTRVKSIMLQLKSELDHSLPFAMDPVVYDFAINPNGTTSQLQTGPAALMTPGYYRHILPGALREDPRNLSDTTRSEIEHFQHRAAESKPYATARDSLIDNLLPKSIVNGTTGETLDTLLTENGFDKVHHESIRDDLRAGRIGLSKNRLAASSTVEDIQPGDVELASDKYTAVGEAALCNGEVAIVTLAAGAASRWTEGAGVVKGLHPFCKFSDRHRTFLEVHLAKTKKAGNHAGIAPLHIITTSYLTDPPIRKFLDQVNYYGQAETVRLSRGRSIGLRLVPMQRDLRFEWEETSQQRLDERAQKMRESLNVALLNWAQETGEGSDYRDNLPLQCLHPVGHWYEIPNLLLNGTLHDIIQTRPQLRTLMLHNIDTLGADLNPAMLGYHRASGAALTFEVIQRRLEDRGGGLARLNGKVQLIEGLAMPREEDEFRLTYYNTNTCWIDIDKMLAAFALTREDLADTQKVATALRNFSHRLPTYVTLKEVKKRWGHGQEDIFPVAQFEKLWGDMTALSKVPCSYIEVPRQRGQQLKEQAQLDGWLRDGSKDHVESLCDFTHP